MLATNREARKAAMLIKRTVLHVSTYSFYPWTIRGRYCFRARCIGRSLSAYLNLHHIFRRLSDITLWKGVAQSVYLRMKFCKKKKKIAVEASFEMSVCKFQKCLYHYFYKAYVGRYSQKRVKKHAWPTVYFAN